jgi:two-component system, OmpR family, response regulator
MDNLGKRRVRSMTKSTATRPRLEKTVFTTGEVADICNLSQQTIIRCFDSGKLRGFRVPGSKFRKVPRESLIQFMKSNDIPLDRLELGKTRVLVVDDDEAIVGILMEVLERDGRFEVQTASTGFDAGLRTREFLPDLIILDFMLPDINGNRVCQSIRNDPTLQDVRILMVSGAVGTAQVEELFAAGADAFMKKPFKMDELLSKITELLQK